MRIRRQTIVRSLLVAVPCVALLALVATAATGNQKDTPELVMQAAGQTAQHNLSVTRALARALDENNAYVQHLQTDRAFAAAVLAAGQKSDRTTMVSLIKRFSPSGEVTITQLDPDFTHHWKKVIKTEDGDITIEGCVSTTNSCNGGFVSVTVK
jgi:hypothetical protein